MLLVEFLNEESNSKLASHYSRALNTRFQPYDIPVKITSHFIDRMLDPRNKEIITAAEIADFFSKLLLKKRQYLQDIPEGSSVQVVDLESDVTIPFVKSNGVLIATTVMRGSMRRGSQNKIAI